MIGLGIVVALVASVANAFAVVLQAAEDRRAPASEGGRPSLLLRLAHRPRWLAGTALLVLAWPLQVLALALAPITVVQPTLSTTQLILLAVARVRLRERVGPLEAFGALAIVAGTTAVVWAAPRHTAHDPEAARLAVPLAVVGAAALVTYAVGRFRRQTQLALVIGAGLAYAWADFANKLVANDLSTAHWTVAAAWLSATLCFGALAFLEETTALQQRPAVTVSPVVGAIQDPLPVVMALWAGVETWGSGARHIAPLVFGLATVTVGATLLGRSQAVARTSGQAHVAPRSGGARRRARHADPGLTDVFCGH